MGSFEQEIFGWKETHERNRKLIDLVSTINEKREILYGIKFLKNIHRLSHDSKSKYLENSFLSDFQSYYKSKQTNKPNDMGTYNL